MPSMDKSAEGKRPAAVGAILSILGVMDLLMVETELEDDPIEQNAVAVHADRQRDLENSMNGIDGLEKSMVEVEAVGTASGGTATYETEPCEIEPLSKNQSQTEKSSLEYEETSGANRQFSTSKTSK